MIYFILAKHKFVKIGYSANPKSRLKELSTGNPFKLKLLATMPGLHFTEKELHTVFERFRMEGEWFRYDGQLKACIDSFRFHKRKHKEVKTVRQLLENGMHWQVCQKLKRNSNFKRKFENSVAV